MHAESRVPHMPKADKVLVVSSQAWAVGTERSLHLPLTHYLAWVQRRRRGKGSWVTSQTREQTGPEELTSPWAAVPGVPGDHGAQESLQR